MSEWMLLAYFGAALVAILLSALFSGLETGIYTLNRVRLAVRAAHGDRAAVRIRREIEHPNRTLSMLLIGTNTASYLASFSLAEILHGFGFDDWTLIAISALVLAPLLFVFAETLPKDLFRTHTDRWTYSLSGVLVVTRWVFVAVGLLPLVHGTGRLVTRLFGASPEGAVSARQYISQLIKEGAGTGVLSESQTTLADRALAIRNRTVGTEMIHWHAVVTVPVKADRAARNATMRRHEFTRMPVVDRAGRVVGILSMLDALLDPNRSTTDMMTEPLFFGVGTPLRDALQVMRLKRQAMAIAVDAQGGRPRGIVTLKDLVEPITGELEAW